MVTGATKYGNRPSITRPCFWLTILCKIKSRVRVFGYLDNKLHLDPLLQLCATCMMWLKRAGVDGLRLQTDQPFLAKLRNFLKFRDHMGKSRL